MKKGGAAMVIYADILVILNLIVDYMLLLVTGKIIKLRPPAVRQIAAAFVGGAFISLHICPERRYYWRNIYTDCLLRCYGTYKLRF